MHYKYLPLKSIFIFLFSMATGLAIAVTVVGIAAIIALLGVLARQLGFWTWVVNWLKATSEEKTKLCRPEQVPTNSGRPYLVSNF